MFLPITNSVFARALRWWCLASVRPNIHRCLWENIHRHLGESVCTFDRGSQAPQTNMHQLANKAETDLIVLRDDRYISAAFNYYSHAENWPSCYEISETIQGSSCHSIIYCWHFKQNLETKKRTNIIHKFVVGVNTKLQSHCGLVRQFCFLASFSA